MAMDGGIKRWRLIVRNMDFKTTEEQLRSHFEAAGEVLEATIPTKKGFGFVQLKTKEMAEEAVEKMNGSKIANYWRPISVDFSIPKNQYEKIMSGVESEVQPTHRVERDGNSKREPEMEVESESDISMDDLSEAESVPEFISLDKEKRREMEKRHPVPSKPKKHETAGIFIPNLPLSVDKEDMKSYLESTLGRTIVSCYIVKEKITGQSKGSGFVYFENEEEVEDVLAGEPVHLKGRKLIFMRALSREKLGEELEKKHPKRTSKKEMTQQERSLELISLGGAEDASGDMEGLTEEEKTRRRLELREKQRKLLQNPNLYISPTRLCIRNVPFSMDVKAFKKTIRAKAGPGTKVHQCKIVTDKEKKSRGYGFVEFTNHEDAFRVLKNLNNKSGVFIDEKGKDHPPVIEFAVEKRGALRKHTLNRLHGKQTSKRGTRSAVKGVRKRFGDGKGKGKAETKAKTKRKKKRI